MCVYVLAVISYTDGVPEDLIKSLEKVRNLNKLKITQMHVFGCDVCSIKCSA